MIRNSRMSEIYTGSDKEIFPFSEPVWILLTQKSRDGGGRRKSKKSKSGFTFYFFTFISEHSTAIRHFLFPQSR